MYVTMYTIGIHVYIHISLYCEILDDEVYIKIYILIIPQIYLHKCFIKGYSSLTFNFEIVYGSSV